MVSLPIPTGKRAAGTRVARRLVLVVLLLLAEYVVSAAVIDSDPIDALPGWWNPARHFVLLFMTGAVVALCALVVFWRDPARVALATTTAPPQAWLAPWLSAHVLSFAVLGLVTHAVVSVPGLAGAGGLALLGLWLGAGGLMAFSLFKAAFGDALAGLARGLASIVLAAAVVGALAVLLLPLLLPLWSQIGRPTMYLAAALLALSDSAVFIDPVQSVLQIDDFAVQVDARCSGIEGMGLVTLMLAGYLFRFRAEHRFPHALIILPAGMALAFLANGLRIALLIALGAYVDPDLASSAFHANAGWIFFCTLTIGLVALARAVPWFRAEEAAPADSIPADNPTAGYLLPFLTWLAVGLLASAWATGSDPFYPLRVLAVLPVLYVYRRDYAGIASSRPGAQAGRASAVAAPWLIGLAVAALWLVLSPSGEPPRSAMVVAAAAGWTPGFLLVWLAFRIVGTAMLVPVIEELAFRGFLQRRLIAADFTAVPQGEWRWLPVLASALVFGLMHGNWLAGMLAGIGFSLAVGVRGRLTDAMIAHGVANAVLAACVLGFGRWDLW